MVMERMKSVKILILFVLSLSSGGLFAASFDCGKAKSFSEKTICENPVLSERDDDLKVVYDHAKNVVRDKRAFSEVTRQLWNGREKCKDYECVAGWYNDAFVIYNSVINKAAIESSKNNTKGSGVGGIESDGGLKTVSPKASYQLKIEADFVEAIKESMEKASNAKNEMQIGGIKSARDRDICNILKVKSVSGWIGEVKQVTANSDGKGVLKLSLPNNIIIRTWNNSFSDIRYNTLIEPGTNVFNSASELNVGDVVYFSGTFFDDDDNCISEASLSLSGKIKEPEFIFKFSDIRKYRD